jgi:hypothetical protein
MTHASRTAFATAMYPPPRAFLQVLATLFLMFLSFHSFLRDDSRAARPRAAERPRSRQGTSGPSPASTPQRTLAARTRLRLVKPALARMKQAFAGERVNDSDGVRVDFADGWVHLRASNTEPIARIIAEAPTAARAQELIAMCAKAAGL